MMILIGAFMMTLLKACERFPLSILYLMNDFDEIRPCQGKKSRLAKAVIKN